ncbi:hypothetical protein [Coleofasciculus sp. FACHB-T130]|uniref:hypothetical protein n=1 Tax=Cyanophyceae TaxID=3028117 RepID=UPI00168A0D35|nr:hypothetical protein [Coleofasciculus sp. FACHB-T130]MBD1882157.1 hypothetical protein [Coleofasciculus sp. FACHB-T130]
MRSHSPPNQERDRSFSLSLWVERTARNSLGILESEWLKLKRIALERQKRNERLFNWFKHIKTKLPDFFINI